MRRDEVLAHSVEDAYRLLADTSMWMLVLDQFDKGLADESVAFRGAWGRSTIDYCFLGTSEPVFSAFKGSITQTAWALLGFRAIGHEGPKGSYVLSGALERAAAYVKKVLDHEAAGDSPYKKDRHVATVLLAAFLLEEMGMLVFDRDDKDPTDYFAGLKQYRLRLKECLGGSGGVPPEDVALFAAYPLLLHTIFRLAESKGESHESTKGLPAYIIEHSRVWLSDYAPLRDTVATVLRDVQWERLPRPSPLVAASALLFACDFVHEKDPSDLSDVANILKGRFTHYADRALSSVNMDNLPCATAHHGLVEPWSTLAALLYADDSAFPEERERLAVLLARAVAGPGTSGLRHVLGGSTHVWSAIIHWASTRQGQRLVLAEDACKAFRQTQDPIHDLAWTESLPPTLGQALRNLIPTKFGLARNDSVRDCAVTARAIEQEVALERGRDAESRHVLYARSAAYYQGGILGLRQGEARRLNIVIAGYTGAGKTETVKYLTSDLPVGAIVDRATTWSGFDDDDAPFLRLQPAEDFDKSTDDLLAVHDLIGQKFAFVVKSIDTARNLGARLFQVGWSIPALEEICRFSKSRNEHARLLLLDPGSALEARLQRRASKLPERAADMPNEGSQFYRVARERVQQMREEGIPAACLDSSGSVHELRVQILTSLSDVLSAKRGDAPEVALSFSGQDKNVAEALSDLLRQSNVRSFNYLQRPVPHATVSLWENLSVLYERASMIVLLWSANYRSAVGTAPEWFVARHRLDQESGNVVVLLLDDTAPPFEARKVHCYSYAQHGPDSLVDVAKVVSQRRLRSEHS